MTEPDDLTPWLSTETNELRAAIDGLMPGSVLAMTHPLPALVCKVLDWATSEPHWDYDRDMLVCDVIAKLVERIVELDLNLFCIAGEALDADQIMAKYGHLRPKGE